MDLKILDLDDLEDSSELEQETFAEVPATNPCKEMAQESQGTLSCGGVYVPRALEPSPFQQKYCALYLPNARQQVIMLKNTKPISISNLSGPYLEAEETVERFVEEGNPVLKKFFRSDCN